MFVLISSSLTRTTANAHLPPPSACAHWLAGPYFKTLQDLKLTVRLQIPRNNVSSAVTSFARRILRKSSFKSYLMLFQKSQDTASKTGRARLANQRTKRDELTPQATELEPEGMHATRAGVLWCLSLQNTAETTAPLSATSTATAPLLQTNAVRPLLPPDPFLAALVQQEEDPNCVHPATVGAPTAKPLCLPTFHQFVLKRKQHLCRGDSGVYGALSSFKLMKLKAEYKMWNGWRAIDLMAGIHMDRYTMDGWNNGIAFMGQWIRHAAIEDQTWKTSEWRIRIEQ
ncbi:hypothetical protein C8R45DRAFT_947725 [Mycena sanguinolenta]|nr:hypothetical protein C8R45DRAFT_947725 [Mycena sanguinolenta]